MFKQFVIVCAALAGAMIANAQSDLEAEFTQKLLATQPERAQKARIALAPAVAPAPEDLQVLKENVFKTVIPAADPFLDQAVDLKYQLLEKGQPVAFEKCNEIQVAISKNYPLHTFTDFKDMKRRQGVNLCPERADGEFVFDGEWIRGKSVNLWLAEGPVTNLLNVEGSKILTIEYRLADHNVNVIRQYVLDSKLRMIQFTWAKFEGTLQFYTVISAVNAGGDVLSRTYREWKNPNQAYLWKRWAGYVSAKGDVSPASRYVQNDGKGVEVEQRSYIVPYNWKWDMFELSPYTRSGGLYKIGSETTGWQNSQAQLKLYSKPGAGCGFGYIGWSEKGDYIRTFGNPKCSTEMDVDTTSF